MPESATDRPATAVEYVYMLTKSARYFYDAEAVRMAAKNWGPRNRSNSKLSEPADGSAPDGWLTNGDRAETGRNFRNSDLFYARLEPPHGLISDAEGPLALDVNPAGFAEAHFATFPPKLIEPLIKAATSEKGCCAKCGAPWVREVERGELEPDGTHQKTAASHRVETDKRDTRDKGWSHEKGFMPNAVKPAKTLGWSPSCGCKTRLAVPCTVLDPFGGAGTTGLVADRLGRSAVLIELNPEYAEMARARIHKDAPLFAEVGI